MNTLKLLILTILLSFFGVANGQEEIKFKFSSIDRLVITRNSNGDLQLSYPNNSNDNIFLGDGGSDNTGSKNVGIGQGALLLNGSGFANTALGYRAGISNVNGSRNVFIGADAGLTNDFSNNVFVGVGAGINNQGSGNVFLGFNAGALELGSDKLYISNDFGLPLIYGDFISRNVIVDGTLEATDTIVANGPLVSSATNIAAKLRFETVSPGFSDWEIVGQSSSLRIRGGVNGTGAELPLIVSISPTLSSFRSTVAVENEFTLHSDFQPNLNILSNAYPNWQISGHDLGMYFVANPSPPSSQLFLIETSGSLRTGKKVHLQDITEPFIRFERKNSNLHDWDIRAKNGDLFFQGGADLDVGSLSNLVTMRNNGDLEVCGKIFAASATVTAFSCSSDRRYKQNITPLTDALTSVLALQGVSYDWRRDEFPDMPFTEENQIGFIAQDVEKIFPSMVYTDDEGFKSVDYTRLTPVLTEAIKDQQSKIVELEEMIDQLMSRIETIETALRKQSE